VRFGKPQKTKVLYLDTLQAQVNATSMDTRELQAYCTEWEQLWKALKFVFQIVRPKIETVTRIGFCNSKKLSLLNGASSLVHLKLLPLINIDLAPKKRH